MTDRSWIDQIAREKADANKKAQEAGDARNQRAEDLVRLLPKFWDEMATEIESIKDEFIQKARVSVDSRRDDQGRSISLQMGAHWMELSVLANVGALNISRKLPEQPEKKSIQGPPLEVVGDSLMMPKRQSAKDFANEMCKGFFTTATSR